MIRYVLTFAGLLVLTTATLLLSFVELGSFRVPVALAIAVAKSTLVALIFMHLYEQRHTNWLVFVIAALVATTLVVLSALDVLSRWGVFVTPAGY